MNSLSHSNNTCLMFTFETPFVQTEVFSKWSQNKDFGHALIRSSPKVVLAPPFVVDNKFHERQWTCALRVVLLCLNDLMMSNIHNIMNPNQVCLNSNENSMLGSHTPYVGVDTQSKHSKFLMVNVLVQRMFSSKLFSSHHSNGSV